MVDPNRQNTVLVIGGAGYVGSVLVRRLLEAGTQVVVLDNLIYDNEESIRALVGRPGFRFIEGSFGDRELLDSALGLANDVVLLAAMVGDPICKEYPDLATRTNLTWPKVLLDEMNGRGLDRFIFTSTCSNYGNLDEGTWADEETELNPKSLYAETKVAFEDHIVQELEDVDFCPVILRVATAFGLSPRMRFDLTISEFTRELVLGRELLVYDENTWRPYCHVQDISSAILSALKTPLAAVRGQVFNVGSNSENYTKKMVVGLIQQKIDANSVRYISGGSDPRNYRVSFDKIGQVLDFAAEFEVEAAVVELIDELSFRFRDVDERRNFYGNHLVGGG